MDVKPGQYQNAKENTWNRLNNRYRQSTGDNVRENPCRPPIHVNFYSYRTKRKSTVGLHSY